jgi:ElaB/YqjD/DUF883 family membrane-anchored ribosome-binding protein
MENNMRKTANTLDKGADEMRNTVGDTAQDVLETGRDAWKDIRDRGRTVWKQTRQQSEEAMREAQNLVRKYPARSVGAALLAGALLGFLIAYSSED